VNYIMKKNTKVYVVAIQFVTKNQLKDLNPYALFLNPMSQTI